MPHSILLLHPTGTSPLMLADRLRGLGLPCDVCGYDGAETDLARIISCGVVLMTDASADGTHGLLAALADSRGGSVRPAVVLMADMDDPEERGRLFSLGAHAILSPMACDEELARMLDMCLQVAESHDLTADAEAEIRRVTAMLEKAQGLKDHFLTRISHDMRTPMTTLKLCAELLKSVYPENTPGGQKMADILSVLLRSIQRVETVFRELSTISRLDVDNLRPQCRLVDLNLAVTEAVAECFPDAMQQDIALDVESAELPPVWADAQRVRQMLVNMIVLALIRSETGGHVTVRTFRDGRGVACAVRDAGTEIPARMLENILEGLNADEPSMDTRVELYVISHIAQAHGGTMRYASAPEGTELSVWLPLEQDALDTGDLI